MATTVPHRLFDTEHLKIDLKGRSVRGAAVTVLSQVCKFVLQTGSTLVLARLLTPSDFGLIAMVMSITGFAMIFSSLGLSTATIQKAEINHGQISTLFWINVALGILVAAAVVALAPAIAWFYNDPRLVPITMALGTTFIFGGLAVQHQAMLLRHMRFFSIGVVEVASMAIGVAAAIVSGILGTGYWSLVIMYVAIAAATTIGMWIAFPWLPGRPRRGVGVKGMLGFGGNITGFNIVNYFSRNADNILIGWYWGSGPVGLYSKAYSLLMLPLRQINAPISAVAVPALSRLQNKPERYRRYYIKAISMIALITMPGVIFMIFMSKELVAVLLGPQWERASVIFAVFGIAALGQPIANSTGWLYISQGRSRDMFRWGIIGSSITISSFAIGLPWGPLGVAACYTIFNLAATPLLYWFVCRRGPVRAWDICKGVATPICLSSCLLVTLLVLGRLFKITSPFLRLGGAFVATLSITVSLLFIFPVGRKIWKEVIDVTPHLLKR
jgi:PST family polysaccharide transporter